MSDWIRWLCLKLNPVADPKPLTTMNKLKKTLKKQEKKLEAYEKKASREVKKEEEFRRAGNEKAANLCLEMKRLFDRQIQRLEYFQFLIRKQIVILEGEIARTETVDALESGETELKKMQGVKKTDNGDKTMGEMNEGMENVNEIEDTWSVFSDAATHFDQDEHEAELEELEGADRTSYFAG